MNGNAYWIAALVVGILQTISHHAANISNQP
jgi:hypothetical protein